MKFLIHMSFLCLASLSIALFVAGCTSNGSRSGLKDSDPKLSGPRDMNYDHTIVPGVRVGPVEIGGLVSEAVKHLGNPEYVTHFPNSIEVLFNYPEECVQFRWQDSGINPKITTIDVTCDKWSTRDGLHVGTLVSNVGNQIGAYCAVDHDGSLLIETKKGIWFYAKDRNSPVYRILAMAPWDAWDCKG
jgi:hypothetical protein